MWPTYTYIHINSGKRVKENGRICFRIISAVIHKQNHGNLTKKVENGWNSVVSIVSNMRETLFAVVGKEIIYCLWFHYLYHREIELYTLCVEKERDRESDCERNS